MANKPPPLPAPLLGKAAKPAVRPGAAVQGSHQQQVLFEALNEQGGRCEDCGVTLARPQAGHPASRLAAAPDTPFLTQTPMVNGRTRNRVTCPCCALDHNPSFLAEATSARRVRLYAWDDPGESISPTECTRLLRAGYSAMCENKVPLADQDLYMPSTFLQTVRDYGLPASPIWDAPMDLRLRIRKIAAELQLPEFPTNPKTQPFRAEGWVSTQWFRILKERPSEWRAIRSQMLIMPSRSIVGDDEHWKELRDRGQHLHEAL